MFTWPQWIAIAALMLGSMLFGFSIGKEKSRIMIDYYRQKWLSGDKP